MTVPHNYGTEYRPSNSIILLIDLLILDSNKVSCKNDVHNNYAIYGTES